VNQDCSLLKLLWLYGVMCQPRRWGQAPSLIKKETSAGLVSNE